MADIISQEAAVEFFESLQIPIPVYRPVEGQLRDNVEYALELLQNVSIDDISLHLKLAYALLSVDRREEAAAAFEQLRDSTDITRVKIIAFTERGILLGQKRELEAGVELALQHPHEFPDNDDPFRLHIVERGKYELGRLLYHENDFANAVGYLEAGLNFWQDGFGVHYYLGTSYARIGDYSKAEEHLLFCISLRPGDSELHHHLGRVHFQCARYQEAVRAFVQSAKHAGELSQFRFAAESFKWWCAGNIAAKNCGDYEQAVEYLTLSVKAALKIQEPDLQARGLAASSTWLRICIQAKLKRKTLDELLQDESLEHIALPGIQQEPFNTLEADDEFNNTLQKANLKTLQAEGYGTLGIAMLAYQVYDDAREHLQQAILLLRENSASGVREKLLLFEFQWSEATIYGVLGENQKALDAFQQCKTVAPSEKDMLRCDIRSGIALKAMGKFVGTAAMFAGLEVEYASLLESEPELKAEILLGRGQCLLGVGNATEAVENVEAARCLLEARGCYTSDLLPFAYTMLYNAFIQQGLFLRAFGLITRFNVLREQHAEVKPDQVLHLFAAESSRFLIDYKASEDTLTELLELQDMEDRKLSCAARSALADVYRNQGDFDAAEAKYTEAITSFPAGYDLLLLQIHMNRAQLYMSKAADAELAGEALDISMELNRKALHDYDQVTQILEESGVLPLDLASAYTGKAIVLFHTHEHRVAGEHLDRAMELAGDNELMKAKIKRVRAHLLFADADQFEKAMREGEEAALLFAQIQLKLQHLESAWVTLLEGDMKHLFFLMQRAWVVGRTNYTNALLWAERGRLRLYFHLADQRPGESLPDPLAFDRDDGYARDYITDAVKVCGPGCVFLEYTCSPTQDELYIFVVSHELELMVDFRRVLLKDFFAQQENRALGGSIDALVRRTRTEIKRKLEDKAKAGLGALYRLLVKPVWELLVKHETIIFAPAGSIWLVPFSALYDESCSQFLIQKKKVGIVPSLRALRRCQLRYGGISMECTGAGFVAGDPEPMGLNCRQLHGARKEAIEVAEQLNVAPLIGRDMTKEAVLEGLKSDSRVIALVTHGVVDKLHPHGALVMQGKQLEQNKEMLDVQSLVLQRSLGAMPSPGVSAQSSEVLTAGEIGKLDMRAALVVLSACQTGEGEVPSEGLLGLGRAVLQAGSSCAVVTLWSVDDDATKELMTGMFRELVINKESVVGSLHRSMVKLLESGAPVYMWASAAALGYSMLRLYQLDSPPLPAQAQVLSGLEAEEETVAHAGDSVTNPNSSPPRPKRRNSFCCWKC